MASAGARSHVSHVLAAAALWSSGLVVAAILVPAYSSASTSSSGVATSSSATLVQENGLKVLAPVGLPLLCVAVVWFTLRGRGRRARSGAGVLAWTLTALVGAVSLLGILTIGIFILPVAVLLIVGCALSPTRPPVGERPA